MRFFVSQSRAPGHVSRSIGQERHKEAGRTAQATSGKRTVHPWLTPFPISPTVESRHISFETIRSRLWRLALLGDVSIARAVRLGRRPSPLPRFVSHPLASLSHPGWTDLDFGVEGALLSSRPHYLQPPLATASSLVISLCELRNVLLWAPILGTAGCGSNYLPPRLRVGSWMVR
jgi:hypothetical protein